jgi:hypothetical protein
VGGEFNPAWIDLFKSFKKPIGPMGADGRAPVPKEW